MIDEDEIVYNDDGEAQDDLIESMQLQAELDFEGKIVYNENGVEFTSAPAYMNYVIITDIYHIYWYVPKGLSIHDKRINRDDTNRCVLDLKDKPFDMSFFATLKDPSLLPGDLEFIWSSAEYVNHQVERLLSLRVFL
jgi:hypothetical protein